MARRSVLLLVAALIALAGTAMIVLYVQGIDARATKDQELVEVLVATETIETGESVSSAQEAGKFKTFYSRKAWLRFARAGAGWPEWREALRERSLEGLKPEIRYYRVTGGDR